MSCVSGKVLRRSIEIAGDSSHSVFVWVMLRSEISNVAFGSFSAYRRPNKQPAAPWRKAATQHPHMSCIHQKQSGSSPCPFASNQMHLRRCCGNSVGFDFSSRWLTNYVVRSVALHHSPDDCSRFAYSIFPLFDATARGYASGNFAQKQSVKPAGK